MSESNVDALFQQAITSLSPEEQHVLVRRISDYFAEGKGDEPGGSEDELLRRQRDAIEQTHGMFKGSADASQRHDEIIYGRVKP